jgi:hypothetical protein
MPTRVTHYLHDAMKVEDVAVSNAYAPATNHAVNMLEDVVALVSPFRGRVESMHIRITGLAGLSATPKVFATLSLDAAGDYQVGPSTEAALSLGHTTATAGCAAIELGIPVNQILGGSILYIHLRLDQGTGTWSQSCITWSE